MHLHSFVLESNFLCIPWNSAPLPDYKDEMILTPKQVGILQYRIIRKFFTTSFKRRHINERTLWVMAAGEHTSWWLNLHYIYIYIYIYIYVHNTSVYFIFFSHSLIFLCVAKALGNISLLPQNGKMTPVGLVCDDYFI